MLRGASSLARAFLRDREGTSAIEYGLMVAGLGVVVILSAQFLAAEANRVQTEVVDTLKAAKAK